MPEEPCLGSLLKKIKENVANKIRASRIDKTRRLKHINIFLKKPMKKVFLTSNLKENI